MEKKIKKVKNPALMKLLESILKEKEFSIADLAAKAKVPATKISGMRYGATGSIQPDVALKIARAAGVNPDVFKDHISKIAPHGSRKHKTIRKERKQADIFKVTCPHCEGEGYINVRKV